MSFFLRKSLRFGPIRFNLSKSGIGVSAGVKGLRIGKGPRGTYVHAGRGGIYYRKTLSGKTTGQSAAPPRLPLREISSPQFADSRPDATYQQKRGRIWPWLVCGSVILSGLMIANRLPQTWIAIAVSCLFLLCLVTALLTPPQDEEWRSRARAFGLTTTKLGASLFESPQLGIEPLRRNF